MKFSFKREREILELLEADCQGRGVSFSPHEQISAENYSDRVKEEFLGNHNLDRDTLYHLEQLEKSGYVDELCSCSEWCTFRLTLRGHERLESYRQNALWRRVIRWLRALTDKLITSVGLPILVSIVTVLAMRYLELDK